MKAWIANVAFAAGLMTSGAALAGEYYAISYSKTLLAVADLSNTVANGERITTWMTFVFRPAKDGVQFSVERTEMDCPGKRSRVVSFVSYSAKNEIVDRGGPGVWRDVVPESIGDLTLNALCRPETRDPGLIMLADRKTIVDRYLDRTPD